MVIGVSTRWNAGRHTRGEDMLQEILELGFTTVELGYDLRMDLVPGVQDLVRQGAVKVNSVHNFCPLPVAAPRANPEIYTLADPDSRMRELAVEHTARTLRFAAELGARFAVVHAGNVDMPPMTRDLIALAERGGLFNDEYEKIKLKLQNTRDKKVERQLAYLKEGLEKLVPVIRETGVRVALENLPTWEAIPTEVEMDRLLQTFAADGIAYWHDLGHAAIRENLGFINAGRWLQKLSPHLAGFHIHDVAPPARDHLMPPKGKTNFAALREIARHDLVRVLEPSPNTPAEDVKQALAFLKETWGFTPVTGG